MTCELPARAVELAAKLACLFESDVRLAERLNDAQRRLRHANDQLWLGLHPDALGLVYDDARRVAGDAGTSTLAARITDVLGVGWDEEAARSANVHELAKAGTR
jgi:hypothetical protein